MRKLALSLVFGLALTGAAQATGTIACQTSDGDAGFHIGIGTVPGMAIISAEIEASGQVWRMSDDALAVSQAFSDGESIRIDFTDANLEGLLARVRLFQAHEESDNVMAGTLEVINVGAYAVSCEGP